MSSLRLATASNVQAFQRFFSVLNTSDGKWANSISREALEDEIGRFRVWSGNLGALQKGHSSLDYRLRDSPLLSSNALKFLKELEENLNEALAVVSEARLPYEQQPKPENTDGEDEDDDFFSEDEEEDGSTSFRTELSMRLGEIVDIIDNLYKLSVRIRTPTIRSRSLKAASYKPKDPETGVDILSTYAQYDLQHIKELLSHLRQPYLADEQNEEGFLITRLSAAVTLRRRQFKYWKRHRDKLGVSTITEESLEPVQTSVERPDLLRNVTLEVHPETPVVTVSKEAPSQKTGKTLLSGTEATHHHQSLDDIVDAKSVTSYAVTVKDINGRGVDLPPPPKAANGERDFECPYCYIICPARYGHGRAWRTHLLQDLQPYICTYPDCDSSEQLFRSRREWAEHEASHRKAWRCPEHPAAVYKSHTGLENHLRRKHLDSFPESQLATIVKVGETTTADIRQKCPVCYVSADMDGLGDFQSHVAHHLERIATFALPNSIGDDSDGASGVASRGWSGSTGSHNMSEMSLPSDTTTRPEDRDEMTTDTSRNALRQRLDPNRPLLSADSLNQLPDASQNRLDMIESQLKEPSDFADPRPDDEQLDDRQFDDATPAEFQEHLEQREAFRTYLLSLPGAESVRWYRRYGSWTGQAIFKNDVAGAQALKLFDTKRFPHVKIYQSSDHKSKLNFASSSMTKPERLPSRRQSTGDLQNKEDSRSVSSGSISYDGETEKSTKESILAIDDIPTLRSLYISRRLLQRDQSYAPNDSYNRIISFCYHDLTRLKVDAIVNSANSGMKISKKSTTLNHAVHKAAGPGLAKEVKSKGKVKAGQVELTRGHDLPSTWVIHAARPHYFGLKGMGQFNILTECYRSALKMARNYNFKTLAFPCLGTGGCGFPPRMAARVALQEIREYLDAHADHHIERIVFCVNSAIDEKAYMDFFPVFFPPTHGDLDRARTSTWSANHAALAVQILETRAQVQKVNEELSTDFSLAVPEFDEDILSELSAIDSALASIRGFLLGSKELKRSLGDLKLICSVLQTITDSIAETTELAKDTAGSGRTHQAIWTEYNVLVNTTCATDLAHFLLDCQRFVQCLDNILTREGAETDEMDAIRQRLESYKFKQQDEKGKRAHLDEVLYSREFQRETVSHNREIVRLHQIPSVARLYQVGDLEPKPTLAHPSTRFNHTVCFIRQDITKLEVDIMVNSTDVSAAGMGTLDRTVFQKGGSELREHVKRFGECKEGDVKLTPAYLLPAKHVLHVVPPEQYRKNTRDVLRNIYREILHRAMTMRATSVAIPSIGTGMLMYPRRDSASLAMEEVKRFLESAAPSSLIEKIIFVVYSSNDEFIYKNLLPIYFPPKEYASQVLPATQPVELEGESLSPELSQSPRSPRSPRRTLFGSISEAVRNVRFGNQPEYSRQINTYEEHGLAVGPDAPWTGSTEEADIKDHYPQWNQRLHGIQDELASKEQRGGRLSPLQPELQNPNEVAYRTRSSSHEQGLAASQSIEEKSSVADFPAVFARNSTPTAPQPETTHRAETSPLAAQVLAHLITDLKSRPGSYIGKHADDIASSLSKSPAEVSAALEELAAQRHVHNTVDGSTWVVSRSPTELPVLPQQQKKLATQDVSAAGTIESPMSRLAAQVLSYMGYMCYASGNKGGQTIREIAAALQLPTTEIWPAIRELAARGQIQRSSSDEEMWLITDIPEEALLEANLSSEDIGKEGAEHRKPAAPTAQVRGTPQFNDTPPSPTLPSSSNHPTSSMASSVDMDLTNINIDDFVSYPTSLSARWTLIDKRIVDAKVLTEAEEEFDDTAEGLVVHRVLRRGEVAKWAEKTQNIRKWRGYREARRDEGSKEVGRRARENVSDKDTYQAKLDRVLAGDMAEQELRHFADQDNDRKIGREEHNW